jgi:hypothetical protein
MEARVTWFLSHLDASEEGLKGAIYLPHDILQHLAVDFHAFRQRRLDTVGPAEFHFLPFRAERSDPAR